MIISIEFISDQLKKERTNFFLLRSHGKWIITCVDIKFHEIPPSTGGHFD